MPDNSPGLSDLSANPSGTPVPAWRLCLFWNGYQCKRQRGRLGDPTCHATETTKCKSRSGGAEAGLEGMIEIRAKGCNPDDYRLAYPHDTGVTWTELRTAQWH